VAVIVKRAGIVDQVHDEEPIDLELAEQATI
jgi:hypothetical protein